MKQTYQIPEYILNGSKKEEKIMTIRANRNSYLFFNANVLCIKFYMANDSSRKHYFVCS